MKDEIKKMKVAFVRENPTCTRRFEDETGISQKEFARELRGNGYKVIKIFNYDANFEDFNKWEYLNRK